MDTSIWNIFLDGLMGRWGDGEMGRWGDGEIGYLEVFSIIASIPFTGVCF
ncbi:MULTISPECIES: hypothetical protein [Okeania]|nr:MULTISPECIES: hypothetical protein [Okeania]NET22531.1 hypothetical protein [Okeania sp. SIO1H5]NET95656.1 hypothetical protein [Okeania sp. SIO1H2]